jgi:hypothetical protein
MQTAKRRRTTEAIVASAIAHAAVLAVLVLQAPVMLHAPEEPPGPPQAIIPILLMPRAPPAGGGAAGRPEPLKLHRRPQRFMPPPASVAPLTAPVKQDPEAATTQPAPAQRPSPPVDIPKADLRAALRHGLLGCANAQAVNLDRAERDRCDELMGKGARDAAFLGPGLGLSREKRALLDRAAGKREANAAYLEQAPPAGMARAEPPDYDGTPYTTGVGAADPHSPVQPAPSNRTARKLERLPP